MMALALVLSSSPTATFAREGSPIEKYLGSA